MPLIFRTFAGAKHGPSVLDGAVAYWPLASDGEVDLTDYVQGHDLTNNNSVTRAVGPSDTLADAASFAASSSQYLSVTEASLALGGGSFEVAGWIYVTTTTGTRTAWSDYLTTGNQRSWWVRFLDGTSAPTLTVSSDGSDNINLGSGIAIGTATWAFVDFYFDASAQQIGIAVNNGAFVTASQTAVFKSTGNMAIGGRAGGADFVSGRAAGLAFVRRLLTPAERTWLYNGGDGRDLTKVA